MLSWLATQQAHAGFTGSPDTDTSPTVTLVQSQLQYYNGGVTVTLPPVSISFVVF